MPIDEDIAFGLARQRTLDAGIYSTLGGTMYSGPSISTIIYDEAQQMNATQMLEAIRNVQSDISYMTELPIDYLVHGRNNRDLRRHGVNFIDHAIEFIEPRTDRSIGQLGWYRGKFYFDGYMDRSAELFASYIRNELTSR